MTIPNGEEYFEAVEADIQRENDAAVKKMNAKERARYEAMEEASKILVAAGVPYVFWASPYDDCGAFWRYVKLADDKIPFEKRLEEAEKRATKALIPAMCVWMFPDAEWVVGYDKNKKMIELVGPPMNDGANEEDDNE